MDNFVKVNLVRTVVLNFLCVSMLACGSSESREVVLTSRQAILQCSGEYILNDLRTVPANVKEQVTIFQMPQNQEYSWFVEATGAEEFQLPGNGPIYLDGTTVDSNGYGVISLFGVGQGISIRRDTANELGGEMQWVKTLSDGTLSFIEFQLSHCERVNPKIAIDQREANIYGAQDDLNSFLLNEYATNAQVGSGIHVSESLAALGIDIIVNAEADWESLRSALLADGLIRRSGGKYEYLYHTRAGTEESIGLYVNLLRGPILPL